MSLTKFTQLYFRATPEQLEELRRINEAHHIVCGLILRFDSLWWCGLVPYFGPRRWEAYMKLNRVAMYLFERRTEVLGGNTHG